MLDMLSLEKKVDYVRPRRARDATKILLDETLGVHIGCLIAALIIVVTQPVPNLLRVGVNRTLDDVVEVQFRRGE